MSTIPNIDPQVRYISVEHLRNYGLKRNTTYVVSIHIDEPFAVVLPFGTFLAMQEAIDAKQRRIEDLEELLYQHVPIPAPSGVDAVLDEMGRGDHGEQ